MQAPGLRAAAAPQGKKRVFCDSAAADGEERYVKTPAKESSFERLLGEHGGLIFKIAAAYSRTAAERDDLAQDMALALWRSFDRFDERRGRFSTWLYRVALNTAISHARRESAGRARIAPGALPDVAEPAAAEPDDRALLLRDLIAELDPLNRALMLLYLDEHSYESIADILGITVTNVATKISRIKALLRSQAVAASEEYHGTR